MAVRLNSTTWFTSLTCIVQLAGWAVIAPVAAFVAYVSVLAARAAVSVFKKKPLKATSSAPS
jgi:uncharacterized membrane protein